MFCFSRASVSHLTQSHKQEVSEDIDPLSISEHIDIVCQDPLQLVCQDVDGGKWLQDTDKLPEASPNACADVGYHALFLLDSKTPSMMKGYVKERITEVSDRTIDTIISPPQNPWGILVKSDEVRAELDTRLTVYTRAIPSRIPTTEIKKVKNEFRAIESGNGGSTCQMPQEIITYVESVIQGFKKLDFDALDSDFALSIANRLRVMEPFVQKLANLQTTSEWINYQSLAESSSRWSPEVLTLSRLASLTKERKENVKIHKEIALADPDRMALADAAYKNGNKRKCQELAKIFGNLGESFDQAMAKKGDLEQELSTCKEELRKSSNRCRDDASKYQRDLLNERQNLLNLKTLNKEYEELHRMMCEQIKWRKSFVKASSDDTRSRIKTLDHEIKRLQNLRQQELARQQKLKECDEDLEKVLRAEQGKAEESKVQLTNIEKDATERVKRAEKAKSSAESFHKKVDELHLKVQEEIKGAVDYFQELLKVLAVDCHAAYLSAGKFLAFETLQTEKLYQTEREALNKAIQAAAEAEGDEQDGYQGTVDRANRARRSVFFRCFAVL